MELFAPIQQATIICNSYKKEEIISVFYLYLHCKNVCSILIYFLIEQNVQLIRNGIKKIKSVVMC